MTMVSRPSLRASSSGSWLVVPQSTVTRRLAPRAASEAIASEFGTIAFEQSVRDVDDRRQPAMPQIAPEHRRRGGAVDVVVAEDGNCFTACDCVRQPSRRYRHLRDRIGVRHQRTHRWIEEACNLVHFDPAPRKNTRQKLRNAVLLRDGQRPGRAALIEPVAPGTSACRILNAQKQAPWRGLGDARDHGHWEPANRFRKACNIG